MSNPYYTPTGTPGQAASGSSSAMRAEFVAVQTGFSKLPDFTSATALSLLRINSTNTGIDTTGGSISLGGSFTTVGAYNLTYTLGASVNLTLPTANDTLVGRATTDTLTNKTFDTASNTFKINGSTISGTTGTGSFVLSSAPSISNPTLTAPSLGVATATSINGIGITGTAGKNLTLSNSLTVQSSVGDGKALDVGNGALLSQSGGTVACSNGVTTTVLSVATAGTYLVSLDDGAGHGGGCVVWTSTTGVTILISSGGVANHTFSVSGTNLRLNQTTGGSVTYTVEYTRSNY